MNLDNRSNTALNGVNNFDLIDVAPSDMDYVGMSSVEIVIAQKSEGLVETGQFTLGIAKVCEDFLHKDIDY